MQIVFNNQKINTMETTQTFTMEDGLRVQAEQLKAWKSILKPAKYALLKSYCDVVNKSLKIIDNNNGYSVMRGTDIDNWIANNLMDR